MLEGLISLKNLLASLIIPLCFITAWGLLFLIVSNLFFALKHFSR